MNLYARVVARVERWIESVDRERDDLARALSWDVLSGVEAAFIKARLNVLDEDRTRAVQLLAALQIHCCRPELMFLERPKHERMLRLPLRRKSDRRSA